MAEDYGMFNSLVPAGAGAAVAAPSAEPEDFGMFNTLVPKPRGTLAEMGRAGVRGAIVAAGHAITGPAALVGAPDSGVAQFGEGISKYGRSFAPTPGREEGFLSNQLPEFMGGIVPGLAATLGASALGGPVAGAATGVGVFAPQGAGASAEEARHMGGTPGEQQLAAATGAATGAALAMVPAGVLTKAAARFIPRLAESGLAGGAARTGAAAVEGAGIGAGGQVAGNLVAGQTYDPARSLMANVPEAAALTGAGMGLLHPVLGVGPRNLRRSGEEPPPPPPPPPAPEPPLLLPSPAIPMGGPGSPRGPIIQNEPQRALPPPRPLDAAGRAQIARTTADAGVDALGPRSDAPNQFTMQRQSDPLSLISRYENPSGNPLLGYRNTDLSRYPLTETSFPDWPGKPGPKGNSTAAGLYQIVRSTWDPIARRLGIKDFSPESQRAVAEELYRTRGFEPWAPHNPRLAEAIARGEAGEMPAGGGAGRGGAGGTPEPVGGSTPMLALPRPERTASDDFLMTDTKTAEPQKAAEAKAPPSPLETVLAAVSRLPPGEPVTRRLLSQISGSKSQDQIATLRDRLVSRGLVASEGGRYTRAPTINPPEVFAPRAPEPVAQRPITAFNDQQAPITTANGPQAPGSRLVEVAPEQFVASPPPRPGVVREQFAEPRPVAENSAPEARSATTDLAAPPEARQTVTGQARDWYQSTFMGGQRPNNAALREKVYEWSPELRQAHEETRAAARAKMEAEDPSKGNSIAPPELTQAAEAAAQRERAIYSDARQQALAAIRGEGTLPPRGYREQRPDDPISPAGPLDRTAIRDELYRLVKERAPTLRLRTMNDVVGQIEGRESPIHGKYYTETRPGGLMEHIAEVALSGPDAPGALSHEIVHFLKRSGLFNRSEWAILAGKADKWAERFKIDERYGDQSPGIRREEAVAEAYSAWSRGEMQQPPGIRRIFGEVKQFFERVGNWLRGQGFQAPEDVFRSIDRGEVGRRGVEPEPALKPATMPHDDLDQVPWTAEDTARFGEPWPGWSEGAPMPMRGINREGSPVERPQGETLHARPAAKDPRVDAALRAIRVMPDERPLWQRSLDFMKKTAVRAYEEGRQASIDSLNRIATIEKMGNNGKLLDASVSGFKNAHFTRELPAIMNATVGVPDGQGGFLGGAPMLKGGAYMSNPDSKPLNAGFRPIFDAGRQDAYELWWAVNRGKRLMSEGRERLITPEIIAEHKNDHLRPENLGANGDNLFLNAQREWTKFNKHILDFSEQTGNINKEMRDMWERGDYVPFFRNLGEDNPIGPGKGARGIANQNSGIKQLLGGTEKLNSLYENAYLVTEAMISRSLKNHAMLLTRDIAEPAGFMHEIPLAEQMASKGKGKRGDDTVTLMDGGKQKSYRVTDRLLYKSIADFGPLQANAITEFLGYPKRLLTTMVTHEPTFQIANMIRDAPHAWLVSGEKFTPGLDTAKGIMSALRHSPEAMAIMAGGGGGAHFYGGPGSARAFVRNLERGEDKWTLLNSPRKVWEALDRAGSASEMANRIPIHEAVLKRGGSQAEAAWQSKDLLNFTASGGSELMKFIIQTVPFMNARLQGLDRLGRGAVDHPGSFALRGSLLTAAALGLWAINKDNPEYQALPDYEKQAYTHLFLPGGYSFRIPNPFEVGAIFMSVPTIFADFADNGNQSQLWKAFYTLMKDQLNLWPIPQAVAPALDLAKNTSWSGGPIVNEAEQHLIPGERFGAKTSPVAVALGQQLGLSPDQIEYALKGYGGTLGGYALTASDELLTAATGKVRPEKRIEQYPIISRFIRSEPAAANRWVNGFYDLKTEVGQLHATMKAMIAAGRVEDAQELVRGNREMLGYYPTTQALSVPLTAIRKMERDVTNNQNLSSAEMRERLDQLKRARNAIGERARELVQRAHP